MGALDESPEWEKIPRAERDELSAVLGKESRQIKLRRWLDGGYSGSPVALIRDTMSGRPSREMILKFCSRGFPEVHGLEYAYELAPDEFSAQHLVAVKRTFPLREWWGVLTEIAGGDLSLPSLAIYLTDDQLPKICGILIKSILADWNSGNRELGEEINTGNFLRRVVGPHKIEDGGSLSDFASRVGLSWHDPWIRRRGWDEPLRNPLAMLSEDFGGEMFAVVGIGHGDLSVFNVLIRGMPDMEPPGYWLIDYGASNDKHPLTRDPIYLLLSLATQWLQGITITHRTSQSLIRLLANSEDRVKSSQLLFYEKVRDEIYNTGYEWANDKSYGHYWKPQSQLSMIGCALAFIGRKIGDLEVTVTNDWLFDLAAVAATEYCRVHKPEPAPMPSTLPLRESLPPGPLPPGPLATSPPSLTVVEPPAVSGQAAELIGALEGATFGREHWTQLELGTRDLRARLGQGFEAGTESSVLIAGLIAELRQVLDGAISSLVSPESLSRACRRAEDLRERLITLLRSLTGRAWHGESEQFRQGPVGPECRAGKYRPVVSGPAFRADAPHGKQGQSGYRLPETRGETPGFACRAAERSTDGFRCVPAADKDDFWCNDNTCELPVR